MCVKYYLSIFIVFIIGDWGLGIGDWGLGIGPNPQSPIPNPHSDCLNKFKINIIIKYYINKLIVKDKII